MLTLIMIDLKRRIKSPMTWFIILILFMMSLLNIVENNEARLNRPFNGHVAFSWGNNPIDWAQFYDEGDRISIPKAVYSSEVLTKSQEDIIIANEENDIKETVKVSAFYHLLFAKAVYVSNDSIGDADFHNKVIEMWDDVSGGIPYEDINFYPRGFNTGGYNDLLSAQYYHQLYINDLEPIYSDDVNNVTYLYYYFFNIVPMLIVIIAILFIYNSINKEKNAGSLKLILTQSISRWKYYISKWISGVLHVVFTIFLPPLVISTILGVQKGFVSLKYPVIYLRNSMTTFQTIPNHFDAIKIQGVNAKLNQFFSHMAPRTNRLDNSYGPHDSMEVIPFFQFLLMVVLLTILFIAFAVALTQLISAIINKEIISFVGATGVFGAGTLLSSPFKQGKSLNLSPFTMENGSRIVIGTYNVTTLGSTLILLGSTALLLVIGCRYFKRKEI